MAQVPYSPVQEQGLENIATPGIRVDAPFAAFGGATAEAMGRLGNTLEKSGDELFARAYAMQQLNNEAEAREADAQYMIEAGQLHANYNALEGKERAMAFPKYQQDLQESRQKIRGGLSNDMARRMYDSQSLSTMGRSIFNGAGAAATASRQYQHDSATAQIKALTQNVEDNPSDPGLFDDNVRRAKKAAAEAAKLKSGDTDDGPIVQQAQKDVESEMLSAQIIGLSKRKPFEAKELLDKNKGRMNEKDYLRADSIVTTQGRGVGAANIAERVWGSDKTLEQMHQEARDMAAKMSPDDPLLANHAVVNVNSRYNQFKAGVKQQEQEDQQSVYDLVTKYRPKNEQEFNQLPGANDLTARMKPSELAKLPSRIYEYNRSADRYVNDKRYIELRGMAQSDDPAAVEEFLNKNVMDEKVDQRQMVSLMNMQKTIKDKGADPRVKAAAQTMRDTFGSQLQALGIRNRDPKHPEDYDHYMGALSSAIDAWNEAHPGKPATAKDIKDTIGPQIIRQNTEPWIKLPFIGGVGTTTGDPFFKQTVPDEAAAKIRQRHQNPNYPAELIYREYIKDQLSDLYATKKGDKAQ